MATTVTKIIDPDMGAGYDYDSLFDWEAAQQGDLTGARDEIAVATCRCTNGTADTTAVIVDGWTTSATQYIKIWTDPAESYRHDGKWNTNKYYLETNFSTTDNSAIRTNEDYVRIEGLQVRTICSGVISGYMVGIYVAATSGIGNSDIRISNSIIRHSVTSGSVAYNNGIFSDHGTVKIWNVIVYDVQGTSKGRGIGAATDSIIYAYNCTAVDNTNNYDNDSSVPFVVKNSIGKIYGGESFGDYYDAASNYNSTDGGTVPGGSSRNQQTFTFVDEANDDFHLKQSDIGALGYGLYDAGSGLYSTDLEGLARGGSGSFWSIGALGVYQERTFVVDPDMGSGYNYDSLYDWEAGRQSILVMPEVVKCRSTGGTADTTAVTIDGWTTSATQYIKVWTDPAENYKHDGKWNTNKYRLIVGDNGSTFISSENYITIAGLQIQRTTHAADNTYVVDVTSNVGFNFIGNIVRGNGDIDWYDSGLSITGGDGPIQIYNNLMIDVGGGSTSKGYSINTTSSNGVWYYYNNTIIGFSLSIGINRADGIGYAKNNLIKSCTNALSGTYAAGSGYNATDIDTMGYTVTGGATGDRVSQTFTFVDSANGDYHLASNDAGAKGYGVSDPGSGLFSDDIDGQTRTGAWDIGADQYIASITYFGQCDPSGSPDATLDDYYPFDQPISFGNKNQTYTCPGSGLQNVKELSVYVRERTNPAGNVRLGIYEADGTFIGGGASEVAISNTTFGWVGHVNMTGIQLIGGNSYKLVASLDSGRNVYTKYKLGTNGDHNFNTTDYTNSEFPATFWNASDDDFQKAIRCGVKPVSIATISGTAIASITETDIVNGGKTIIITLTGDTWVTA